MKRRPPQLDKPLVRRRALSQEEAQLWQEVNKDILRPETFIEGRPRAGGDLGKDSRLRGGDTSNHTELQESSPPRKKERPATVVRVPVPHFDKNTLTKLRRGTVAIDATLDLHGHTRETAYGVLVRFIAQAQARGLRAVLVITGKGRGGAPGTLCEMLPRWLNESPLQERIIAYDSAHPRHGGSGAWYIRIRKAAAQ